MDSFAATLRETGPDILVNNAGQNKNALFAEINLDDFDALHRINLRAPTVLIKAVLPKIRENNWGRIINIGSIWSKLARPSRARDAPPERPEYSERATEAGLSDRGDSFGRCPPLQRCRQVHIDRAALPVYYDALRHGTHQRAVEGRSG